LAPFRDPHPATASCFFQITFPLFRLARYFQDPSPQRSPFRYNCPPPLVRLVSFFFPLFGKMFSNLAGYSHIALVRCLGSRILILNQTRTFFYFLSSLHRWSSYRFVTGFFLNFVTTLILVGQASESCLCKSFSRSFSPPKGFGYPPVCCLAGVRAVFFEGRFAPFSFLCAFKLPIFFFLCWHSDRCLDAPLWCFESLPRGTIPRFATSKFLSDRDPGSHRIRS